MNETLEAITEALKLLLQLRGQLFGEGNTYGLSKLRRVTTYLEHQQAKEAGTHFAEPVEETA